MDPHESQQAVIDFTELTASGLHSSSSENSLSGSGVAHSSLNPMPGSVSSEDMMLRIFH